MRSQPSSRPSFRFGRSAFTIVAVLYGAAFLSAQRGPAPPPAPGDPLAGLSAAEFAEFRLGLDDFLEVETADEGLGPAFNGTSCAVCHSVPAVGGMGTIAEVRAVGRNELGELGPLYPDGETLFQLFSVPTHGCQAIVPSGAAVFARRIPIPLFGAGLVEAIPDDALLAMEDPLDSNRDGISGRAARVRDVASGASRIGRFGWKAQHATLLAFAADAYRNEMGITNDLFPDELALGVSAERMKVCDPMPDPEDIVDPRTRRRGIDNFESFMRFLAPVGRAGSVSTQAGEQIFAIVGCANCHVQRLTTGANANRLFDRTSVEPFSDFLLHDVGTGDGIPQGAALPSEMRTPALWGLRFRRPFLHDGSASTIDEAIRRHRGEAELARLGFERLSEADRQALLAFLRSL